MPGSAKPWTSTSAPNGFALPPTMTLSYAGTVAYVFASATISTPNRKRSMNRCWGTEPAALTKTCLGQAHVQPHGRGKRSGAVAGIQSKLDRNAATSEPWLCQRGRPSVNAVRFLRRRAHSPMRGTGACFDIAERPPVAPCNISARMSRDVGIRYSTVGVVPSANSADPSSGRLWR
jgi:hypothetical protein